MQTRIYLAFAAFIVTMTAVTATNGLIDGLADNASIRLPLLAVATSAIAAFCIGRIAIDLRSQSNANDR